MARDQRPPSPRARGRGRKRDRQTLQDRPRARQERTPLTPFLGARARIAAEVVLLLSASSLLLGAKRADDQAHIVRPADQIPNLQFDQTSLDVELDDHGKIERPYVMLNGRFKARDGSLTISSMGNRPIKLDQGERFKFRVYLKSKDTRFDLAEVDALGHVKYETLNVNFEGWQNFREDLELDFKRELQFIPSVGLTSVSYSEDGVEDQSHIRLSEIVVTPKLTVNYRFLPRWSLGVNGFFSAFALSSTLQGFSPAIPGFVLRFLGVNGRLAYQLSSVRDPWNLSLAMGVYYTTTRPSVENVLGFHDLMGPQFMANLKYRYNLRDSLLATFKFAPVGQGFYLNSLSNHEIALGIGVARAFKDGKHIGSITLDWAKLSIFLSDPAKGSAQFNNSTLSLSAAYTL